MWFDGIRQPNTLYVASVSRGKDSTAMLRAIQLMGWPLDAITSVDVWATQDIPAELPPMVEFKDEWDKKCFEWFGIPVTRVCATHTHTRTPTSSVTKTCSTSGLIAEDSLETSKDSRQPFTDGVDTSKSKKLTYEDLFYKPCNGKIAMKAGVMRRGFPCLKATWCTSALKQDAIKRQLLFRKSPLERRARK